MKVIYIANARIPTEKAHGIQIMKMCEAFANAGVDVELIAPKRRNKIKADPFDYYGVKQNFLIKKLFCLDLVGTIPRLGFLIQSVSFAKAAVWYVRKFNGVIYSREVLPLYIASFFKDNLYWEVHRGEYNFLIRRLIKKCVGVITITQGLKDFYASKDIDPEKILVAPDGVDLEKFDIDISKEDACKKVGLPQDAKIVMYTGHLYDWKGADVLLEAAKQFSISNDQFSKSTKFVFVGGTEGDIEKFKEKATGLDNVLILGHKPYKDMPLYLKAADVLMLPNSGKTKMSAKYTSPMKLFTYMAAGKPVVASNLPSIREILNESNAILVGADNPDAILKGIEQAFERDSQVAAKAREDVGQYTWGRRAENIIKFIS